MQLHANIRIALDTEVEAGGAVLNWSREDMYRRGLAAAAMLVIRWAEEGCGGAGVGVVDQRSKNLANAINRIDPMKGY